MDTANSRIIGEFSQVYAVDNSFIHPITFSGELSLHLRIRTIGPTVSAVDFINLNGEQVDVPEGMTAKMTEHVLFEDGWVHEKMFWCSSKSHVLLFYKGKKFCEIKPVATSIVRLSNDF